MTMIIVLFYQSTHRPASTQEGTAAEGMVGVEEEGMYEDFIGVTTILRVASTHVVVILMYYGCSSCTLCMTLKTAAVCLGVFSVTSCFCSVGLHRLSTIHY